MQKVINKIVKRLRRTKFIQKYQKVEQKFVKK